MAICYSIFAENLKDSQLLVNKEYVNITTGPNKKEKSFYSIGLITFFAAFMSF